MKIRISQRAGFETEIILVASDSKELPRDFKGDKGETAVRYRHAGTIIYAGLGKGGTVTRRVVQASAAAAAREVASLRRTTVSLHAPKIKEKEESFAEAALTGALLGFYGFDRYKSEKRPQVMELELVGGDLTLKKASAIKGICESVNYARDLVNENASTLYPARLAAEARKLCRGQSMICTVLDEKAIEKKGLGLLKAVGQGSPFPPRLIIMRYIGAPRLRKKTALVGKGITFDSGGQNLKPSGHIETMRQDMAGAAAVLGTMKALLVLKPRINVVGVIAAAHNAIGNDAYFPGDVYASHSGKTVEITNTDAEGRLVLADAFSYVQKTEKPTELVDLATLTGGIIVALGDTVAGLFSNDDALAKALYESGEATGERLWRLPVYEEFSEVMKSDLADLRNTAKLKKGYASSITGAAFLQEFVRDIPWAHLDIAGTAFNEREERGEVPKLATGFGVRLLIDYLTA